MKSPEDSREKSVADHIDAALRRHMDRSLKKYVGNEIIVLTPVLDVFSPIYKMSTAEDDLHRSFKQ